MQIRSSLVRFLSIAFSAALVAGCGGGSSTTPVAVSGVTTLAGTGTAGFANGPGASATFDQPWGVAVDSAGNVYVAETNQAIRKITAAGVVSTLAGTGAIGFTNGPGASATFHAPYGIAIDSAGNAYVGEFGNNAIRKITAAGVVSTLAGTGAVGFANGAGASATFFDPWGVAVDSAGNVYVADTGNNVIRKITAAGVVSTFAGTGDAGSTDGPGASATFVWPYGVAVDSAGNLYVAGNNKIRKITAAGVVSTFAGTGATGFTNGPGASATFSDPVGIAVDGAGNVYVAEEGNNAIRKVTAAGVVSTLAGTGTAGFANGPNASATFNGPYAVAVDSAGNVYVADRDNNAIRKITP
jgi:sugar lactone lactonase YvrE